MLLFLAAPTLARAQDVSVVRARHAIIISVDGLRPDAITQARAPYLQRLVRQGAYSPVAQTVRPPVTIPAHLSMITGLDPNRHRVRWNQYRRGYYPRETIFSIAKKAGLRTAVFLGKQKLNYLVDPEYLDLQYSDRPLPYRPVDTSAAGLAGAFATAWQAGTYALALVHIREPDIAGHLYGWMSRPYFSAVEKADGAIGTIIAALRRSGSWDKTALVVTADHGGSGFRHGPLRPENLTIPWIAVAPGVQTGVRIERAISISDTAPTVLALLGLPTPDNLDGRIVTELFKVASGAQRTRPTAK